MFLYSLSAVRLTLRGQISNCPHRSPDLSDKNPLHALPHDADLIELLALFAEGAHKGAEPHPVEAGQQGNLYQCLSSHRLLQMSFSEL